jgi:uncharacterized hydrophobic protein (TIGR00271 family)
MKNSLWRLTSHDLTDGDFEDIRKEIADAASFRGVNLWILIIAIFVASLGLNLNSTAVVIGAMLISPLMGPIIGLGLGASINDLLLLKTAARNYLFATGASLLTSTIYFLITPLDDAHAELLARTSPNFYDVLIALFGGMAGAVAMTFRNKGNVLTGVAIATALMPPLCTVGYGIATGQPKFMLGALYLYLINSVFIALATYFYARLIKFPKVQLPDKKVESRSNRVILALTMLTLVPSVYLAYRMVVEQRFIQNAGRYIQTEFTDEGIFILRREIDPSARKISLYLGGNLIDSALEARLKSELPKYKIAAASLILRQGIFRQENQLPIKNDALKDDRFYELFEVKRKYDSMVTLRALKRSLSDEASVLFPEVTGLYFHESGDSMPSQVLVRSSSRTGNGQLDSAALRKWLTMRLGKSDVSLDVVR